MSGEAPREAPKVRSDRLVGMLLAGKYKIIEKIGEGGMGSVYIATDQTLDRKVAIKVLLGRLAEDEIAVRRFEQEAKAISKMQHPNTVTIYEFGEVPAVQDGDDRRLYIAMEFLRGRTLTQLLRAEKTLSPMRASRILRQVCASLSEAHAVGIIHRDLKPDNIFLTEVGSDRDWVKVLDFGVAKLANSESAGTLTQTGMIFGTPKYMSPEQAEGRPIDYRADIYALGVILYELLVGRPPFLSETPVGLLLKHISEPPPPFAKIRPDLGIDPHLEGIALKALAKQPSERHQMVAELAAALEQFERTQSGTFQVPVAGSMSDVRPGLAGPGLPTELIAGQFGAAALTPVPPNAVPSGLSLGSIAPARAPQSRGSTTLPEGPDGDELSPATRATTPLELGDALGALAGTASKPERPLRGLFVGGVVAFAGALGLAAFALSSRTPRVEAVRMDAVTETSVSPALSPKITPVAPPDVPAKTTPDLTGPTTPGTPTGPAAQAEPSERISDQAARTERRGTRPRARARADAPVVQAVARVRFSFKSEPDGALVLLDGQEIGRTPFVREFPRNSGTLKLSVRKRGFQEKIIARSTSRDQEIEVPLVREGRVFERDVDRTRRNGDDERCKDGSKPPCKAVSERRSSRDPLREKVGDLK
ncbi:MAG: serine/threonine protein kinase [Deltaproteobacteria bacterium]|nr:serine/threonine protein kinase [Deltaproteobacteria bacterium]